jgi:transposase InsO family protein
VAARAEAGIERSVASLGDSYDNALAETIIGLYKAELIRQRGPWQAGTASVRRRHEAAEKIARTARCFR